MERRLKLAKQLLNPDDSVLIVTIDEKEYARLGILLEQIFPDAQIQMTSITINPSGAVRKIYSQGPMNMLILFFLVMLMLYNQKVLEMKRKLGGGI